MWIRFCPGKRLLFRIKKMIDHDRVAFSLVLKKQYIVRRFTSDHPSILEKKKIGTLKPPKDK
jgi:hypothetical protein